MEGEKVANPKSDLEDKSDSYAYHQYPSSEERAYYPQVQLGSQDDLPRH
jgi:hypothetical protein